MHYSRNTGKLVQEREGYVPVEIGMLEQPLSETQVAHQPSLDDPHLDTSLG